MAYSKLPGDFEIELPGDWPPCPICTSDTRIALATMRHRGVGFFCGGGLDQLQWEEDNGHKGLWIKHYHFWQGGRFEGLIPSHFVGVPKARDADRRFDINERRKEWIQSEQGACAGCGRPAMRDWHDRKKLLLWLKDYHPAIFNDVMEVVRVMQPPASMSTWFAELLKVRFDLTDAVGRAIKDSLLQADHGVPKAVLKHLWDSWDGPMRRAATNTLAFGYCRVDNNGKSKRLPERETLLRQHIQINWNGDERLARASSEQWDAVQRVLDSIDAYRATEHEGDQETRL